MYYMLHSPEMKSEARRFFYYYSYFLWYIFNILEIFTKNFYSVFHSFSSLFFESQYKGYNKSKRFISNFSTISWRKLVKNKLYLLFFFLQGVAESCLAIFLPALVMGNFMVLNLFLALLLNSFNCEELKSRKEVRKIKEYCR